MKHFIRFFALFFALWLLLSSAACGVTKESTSKGESSMLPSSPRH